jgi:Tfp pilus assembly protein PilV
MLIRYIMNKKRFFGQSLFEVIVAIGVAALILVGAISLSTTSVRNSTFSKNDAVATKYSQEGAEWLREQRDTIWGDLKTMTGKTCLGTLSPSATCPIPNTIYSRGISFQCFIYDPSTDTTTSASCANTSVNLVEATVSTSWTDSQGTHKVDSVTNLTRWH